MTAIAEPPPTDPLWTRARASFARAVADIGGAAAIALMTSLPRRLRRRIVAWLCPLECIVRRLLIAEAAELHRAERARQARAVRIEYIPLRGMAQHWQAHRTPSPRGEGEGGGVNHPRASTSHMSHRAHSHHSSLHPAPQSPPLAGRGGKLHDRSNPESWSAPFSFALPHNPHFVPNARRPRILDLSRDYPAPPPPPAPRILKPGDAPLRLARRFEALRRVLENPRPYAERLARVLAREVRKFSEVARRAIDRGSRTNTYDRADPRLSIDALAAAWEAPDAFEDTS